MVKTRSVEIRGSIGMARNTVSTLLDEACGQSRTVMSSATTARGIYRVFPQTLKTANTLRQILAREAESPKLQKAYPM